MKSLKLPPVFARSAAIAVLIAAASCAASAQDNGQPAEPGPQSRPLGRVALSTATEMVAVEIEIPPGHSSESHSHPATLFAYVVEGEIRSGINNEPPVLYRAGDGWFEPDGSVHSFFENASDTEPATFLVVRVSAILEASPE